MKAEDIEDVQEDLRNFWGEKITGYECVICGYELTKRFPKGFPDEWKMCCNCRDVAEMLAYRTALPRSDLYKEVYKKITLMI